MFTKNLAKSSGRNVILASGVVRRRPLLQCMGALWIVLCLSTLSLTLRGGSILREVYQGIGGNAISDLTNSTIFPDHPTLTNFVSDFFEAPSEFDDNYGQRMHGYITPPVSGNYTFWIASDDNGSLYLSTDEEPANVRLIASVSSWTSSRQWNAYGEQQSAPVQLEAGKNYYILAFQKEGGGGDNLAVRWLRPDGVDEGPIPATYLFPYGTSFTPPIISQQPTDTTAVEGGLATFVVKVKNSDLVKYQWTRNGIPLAGATAGTLSYGPVTLDDDGLLFQAQLTNKLGGTNTSVARLSVTPDVTKPTLASAINIGSGAIRLIFSEPVAAPGAVNAANYTLDHGVTISAAAFGADTKTIILTTSPLAFGTTYSLAVKNVQDRARTPNTIISPSTLSILALEFFSQDIGATGGSIQRVGPGNFNVSGGGADIGGGSDQFQFAWEQRTGDFDIQVRVADTVITDPFVHAGLMARGDLGANSAFAAIFAASAQVGCFYESRTSAGNGTTTASIPGGYPANYPQTWLRLRRVGNTFTGFASLDGQSWTQLGQSSVGLTDPVYVGLALSAENSSLVSSAQFRGYGNTTSQTTVNFVRDREPLGPVNRRTGLVFSEIMYHPKTAAGTTNNLEFIELYNADTIFEDLGGWRLKGGVGYTFPSGFKLPAGATVVIAADPVSLKAAYGITNVVGPFKGALNNGGDSLKLVDDHDATKLDMTFGTTAPWPVAPDGTGHSLVLTRPSYGEDDPRAWGASEAVGGSPGRPETLLPNPQRGVVINEFLAHTDLPQIDYIELYNHNNSPVDLSGCYLSDDPSTNKYKIPAGTVIPARGFLEFDETTLGFRLDAAGEWITLVSADATRLIDGIKFEAQENGVASGRWPDGAATVRRLANPTPGAPNGPWRVEDVVINELMYAPISGDTADEYVELYNRSTNTVKLAGWKFIAGVDYKFPAGTTLPPGGYVVVAKDKAHLMANYPQLNTNNTFGNFDGSFKGSGERVALTMPDEITSTNTLGDIVTNKIDIVVSEVTYVGGGRWGTWSHGGGSSLELVDANADLLRPSSWADSDESQKGAWTTVEITGRLDNGMDGFPPNRLHITMLNQGEALVDDVEVFKSGGQNLLSNGGFETGTGTAATGWVFNGNFSTSGIDSAGAFSGGRCLHVRAQGDGDTAINSIRTTVASGLTTGNIATIRAKVRWVAGWPEVLFRLRGAWLELPSRLTVPKNLGTPGLANSRATANAGPAIYDVTHTPALPRASEAVVVTCRVSDSDGIGAVTLRYRIDPSATLSTVVMRDDGTSGDAVAGDGIYSGTLPGRSGGTLAAFRLQATDANTNGPVTTTFPPLAPARECHVRWDDPFPDGNFAHYHMWNTAASENARSNPLNNTYRDATLVYGNFRVIYNAGFRDKGSPFHGGAGSFAVTGLEDDPLLGTTDRVFRSTGNGGQEETGLRNQVSEWIAKEMGIPLLHSHYMRLFRNGNLHYNVSQDEEIPSRSYAADWFSSDNEADLYKIAFWFEFQDDNSNFGATGATLEQFTTDGGAYKLARYRWNWQTRDFGGTANNYTNIFNLVTAANDNSSSFVPNLLNQANIDGWMRIFAFNRILGNWDSYSYNEGQNMYIYKRQGLPWEMMPWDIDFVLGAGDGASSGLWGGQDPIVNRMFDTPAFRRMLWRAFQDAIAGPLQPAQYGPVIEARRSELVRNNVDGINAPSGVTAYIEQRRNFIAAQLAASDAGQFAITSNGGAGFTSTKPTATLAGTAPFAVASIDVNGTTYPVTWTDFTTFSVNIPLTSATNLITLTGRDRLGNPVPGAVTGITIRYNGAIPQPQDFVVINEIQYHPAAANASFVELYNRSTSTAFDLSGWRLDGLGYTFPNGAVIGANSYLVLASDRAAFGAAYGLTLPVFDIFAGSLDNAGELIKLVRPDAGGLAETVIDDVRYNDNLPWSPNADGFGPSLQLVDPAQDNWRVGNWAATGTNDTNRATPGRANAGVQQTLAAFPLVWLNEVLPNNVGGAKDNQGESDPYIELYNTGTDTIDLSSYYLADNYTNLTQWQFPAGTLLVGHSFLLVWADGQPAQTITGVPHSSFRLNPTNGSVALVRQQGSPLAPAVMDYLNYKQVAPGRSFGSYPDGEPRNRRAFYYATPGGTNNPAFPEIKVTINEFMAENTSTLVNPSNGKFDDWFELFNGGSSAVDLTGYTLTDTLTNATQFTIPPGYVIPPSSFLLVWADSNTKANNPTNADLHVNFKLGKEGEQLGLFSPDGALVDGFSFGAQTNNISQGRFPDGDPGPLVTFETPSPKAPNILAGGNRPPVFGAIPNQTVAELSLLVVQISATDPDAGQTLSYSIGADAPSGVTVDASTGQLTWTPSEAQGPATYTFTVRATDDGLPARTAAQRITIAVSETNRKPVLDPIADAMIDELFLYSFTATATDPDVPVNSIHYSLDPGAPAGASIDDAGIFSWTPAESQGPGVYPITIRATDDGQPALSDAVTFTLTVREVDNAPILSFIPPQTVDEGQTLTFTAQAVDSDTPPASIRYSLEGNLPSGLSIGSFTGIVRWTPTEAQGPATYVVILRATENNDAKLSTAQSFGITVNEVNQPPKLNPLPDVVVAEGSPVVVTASVTDLDLPVQHMTYTLGPGTPAGAGIDPNTGVFTWITPDDTGATTNTITIVATDNGPGNLSDTKSFTVSTTVRFHAVISEIMYRPSVTNAAFVELFNPSAITTQDLGGVQLSGENLRYTFPTGTVLPPGQFLTVAQNQAAFSSTYGANVPVFGEWNGKLDRFGTRLRLLGTNSQGRLDTLDEVNYRASLPWPTNADGSGASLQLIDPRQDNSRVANWTTSSGPKWTRVVANGTASSSLLYLYLESIGDVYVDDVKIVAGDDPDVGDNLVANGDFESDFPGPFTVSANMANSAISTTVKHAGKASLHLVATSPGTTRDSSVFETLPTELTGGAPYTLSFWYLPSSSAATLTLRLSGSGIRTTVNANPDPANAVAYTPSAPNNIAAELAVFPPIWINEVEPVNTLGITDSQGNHGSWIELVNRGLLPVSLDGWSLSPSYTNLTQWSFPAGATVEPGEYLIIFADGKSGATTASEWHTSFTLPPVTGAVALNRPQLDSFAVVDYLDYSVPVADQSFGRDPSDISGGGRVFTTPTPGGPNVVAVPPVLHAGVNPDATVTLTFAAQVGSTYRFEFRTALTEPWQTLDTITATTTTVSKTDTVAPQSERYYRVVVQ
ncbi:MAG TPA: lamin tail domain-containing protein [Candidatus Limnocylindria bacterium]|nr:lamin tail domain-containing protein [Candidatus Limnocylindria bacterium]